MCFSPDTSYKSSTADCDYHQTQELTAPRPCSIARRSIFIQLFQENMEPQVKMPPVKEDNDARNDVPDRGEASGLHRKSKSTVLLPQRIQTGLKVCQAIIS